jgi:hypothetical protein
MTEAFLFSEKVQERKHFHVDDVEVPAIQVEVVKGRHSDQAIATLRNMDGRIY